jgi:hypothetical protein
MRSDGGGRRTEVGGQRAEVRGQRSEIRSRRSEDRGRRSAVFVEDSKLITDKKRFHHRGAESAEIEFIKII